MSRKKKDRIAPGDHIFLWRLALRGGAVWLKELEHAPKKSERKRLVDFGLIDSTTKRDPSTGRGGIYLALSEEGWAALNPSDTKEFSAHPRAGDVLARLLPALDQKLSPIGPSLVELLRFSEDDTLAESAEEVAEPAETINEANPIEGLNPSSRRKADPLPVGKSLADAAVHRVCLDVSQREGEGGIPVPKLRDYVSLSDPVFTEALKRVVADGKVELRPENTEIGNPTSEKGATAVAVNPDEFLSP